MDALVRGTRIAYDDTGMSAAAVLVMLAAAVVHACWNQLLARSGDAHARTAVGMLIGAVVFLPVALVDVRFEPVAWVLAAASVGLELAYFALLATAYTRAPMGVVYPVARGSAPVIVLLAGLFLPGGSVSLLAAAGILLVVVGIGLVHGVDGRARLRDVGLAVTIGGCIAGYTLVDAAAVRHAAPASYIEVVFAAAAGLYAAGVARRTGARALRAVLDRRTAAIGVGVVAAYGLVLVGLTLAPAAPVAALRETSVVFAMLLLMVTGQERVTPVRLGGALVVSGGVAAVVLG